MQHRPQEVTLVPVLQQKSNQLEVRLCGIPSTTLLGCLGHCPFHLAHKPWLEQPQRVHWIIGRNLFVQDLVLDVTNTRVPHLQLSTAAHIKRPSPLNRHGMKKNQFRMPSIPVGPTGYNSCGSFPCRHQTTVKLRVIGYETASAEKHAIHIPHPLWSTLMRPRAAD
jgi:hypothetical protein